MNDSTATFRPARRRWHERGLYQAILTLKTVEECRAFFRDLCTPAELEAMADRWAVVECWSAALPYREIHEATGVSVTTIGRVARYVVRRQRRLRAGRAAPWSAALSTFPPDPPARAIRARRTDSPAMTSSLKSRCRSPAASPTIRSTCWCAAA
jgi:TrpR-related protein YerC/YecD